MYFVGHLSKNTLPSFDCGLMSNCATRDIGNGMCSREDAINHVAEFSGIDKVARPV